MSANSLRARALPGGPPLAIHRLPWTWPVARYLLAAVVMAYATMLAFARGPLFLPAAFFGAGITLLFAGIGLFIIINRPRRIVFFQEGMGLEWLVGSEFVPWERVTSVSAAYGWHIRLDQISLWNPRTVRVQARLADGRRLVFFGERRESDLEPQAGPPRLAIDDAAQLIAEASQPARLSAAATRVAAGQAIAFGGMQLSAHGLAVRGKLLSWEGVADIVGNSEALTVMAVGQSQPWHSLAPAEFTDGDLLLPLVAHLRGRGYSAFQSEGAAPAARLTLNFRWGRLVGLLAVPLLFVAIHFGFRMMTVAYSPEQLQARGEQAFDRGDYEVALRDFDRVVQLRPRSSGAYVDRGRALAELGRYDDALVDYQAALRLCPTCERPVAQRARVLFYKGQLERAIDEYNRAIAVSPDYAFAYCGRGEAHQQLGRLNAARADYNSCLSYAMDPGRKAEAERLLRELPGS